MSRPSDEPRSVSTALTAAGRLLRDRPAAVLPAYLLSIGLAATARVPVTVGLGVAVASLAATGRLEPLVRAAVELQEAARAAGDPGGGIGPGDGPESGSGEIPAGAAEALADAAANAATPTVVAALGIGVVAAVVVGLLARALGSAVSYGTVWAGLDGRDPLVSGVRTAGRWRTFLGLALVRAVVGLVAVGGPLFVGVNLALRPAVIGGDAAAGVAAILLTVGLVGLGVLVLLLTYFLLAFAESAAVVDGRGAVGSIRASLGFVRDHPAHAVGFALVAVGGYVAAAVTVGVANAAGAGSLGGIVLPLFVVPLLDAGATALYAGCDRPEPVERPGFRTRVRRALGHGWSEMTGFVAGHPVAVLAALATLAGGVAAGYATTAPYGVTASGPEDVAGVFGAVPVGPFVTIAANNWLVSVGLAYGGVAFGLPAVSGLLFNGVLVGALAGVFDRTAFLALVAPHGVLELPVIAVAGGLGHHLGGVGWRAVRGRADAEAVAAALERAAHVLVGIGILLVVAAAIEAFLTPRVAAAVLGG
ncbi:stage II sporulation protein M [Halobaculum magnesiiphilum]|uniref:Stage II sporulation protein M n=1 Tax=Halobaculum magnesiiphilum TaxID=1017351 RepID=A0A8T8W9G0_9EURY|nr:stage II sporulation protein M [Halobaculum magnesiiphilum]QZP36414.1 stage II sporulation protein M [Halobaculum magnesiiphilum]